MAGDRRSTHHHLNHLVHQRHRILVVYRDNWFAFASRQERFPELFEGSLQETHQQGEIFSENFFGYRVPVGRLPPCASHDGSLLPV